jgi:hypothetical protein
MQLVAVVIQLVAVVGYPAQNVVFDRESLGSGPQKFG